MERDGPTSTAESGMGRKKIWATSSDATDFPDARFVTRMAPGRNGAAISQPGRLQRRRRPEARAGGTRRRFWRETARTPR